MSTITYNITNHQDFIRKFHDLVDTSVSYTDYRLNPWIATGKYFGEMKWNKFEVYGFGKFLTGKRLIMKATGTAIPSQAKIRLRFINRGTLLFSFIVLFWFGALALQLNFYLGLLILFLSVAQFIYGWLQYYLCKTDFLNAIEKIAAI
ncbi:hypothetical protein GCM10009122_40710 [Fulvivirga kasyanovii]|uniref:Uncharacterized protein n=1 Tax=Fulvivirga kasyanovii TaxID=396812 RepID=A0ABW9RX17_9BACT|nr:hypothetical protein [Fulvivirga kasyanovii]MTI28315.1 hypothetical protein [Fulvivirga kasyanovii]